MSRYSGEGTCPACDARFRFFLVDTDANASGYAYCGACGGTALAPAGDGAPGALHAARVARLVPCLCGGRFRAGAEPRCPECGTALPADACREWIEARGARHRTEWHWQGAWDGRYCIVIENRLVTDADE